MALVTRSRSNSMRLFSCPSGLHARTQGSWPSIFREMSSRSPTWKNRWFSPLFVQNYALVALAEQASDSSISVFFGRITLQLRWHLTPGSLLEATEDERQTVSIGRHEGHRRRSQRPSWAPFRKSIRVSSPVIANCVRATMSRNVFPRQGRDERCPTALGHGREVFPGARSAFFESTGQPRR